MQVFTILQLPHYQEVQKSLGLKKSVTQGKLHLQIHSLNVRHK